MSTASYLGTYIRPKSKKQMLTAYSRCQKARRNGSLIAPDKCSVCGQGGRIIGHHHDYSQPLLLTWLCKSCHAYEHSKVGTSGFSNGGSVGTQIALAPDTLKVLKELIAVRKKDVPDYKPSLTTVGNSAIQKAAIEEINRRKKK